jgi:hypothetical protein
MKRLSLLLLLGAIAIVAIAVPAATAQAPGGYALYLPFDDGLDPTDNLAAPNDGSLEPAGGPLYSTDIPLVDGNVTSLAFDGVDDYVSVASYAALEPAGGFTVSLWAKSSDPGTGNRYLIVKGAQGGLAGTYSLYTAGGNLYFDVFDYLGGSPPWYYAATSPASGVWDGTWHNITGVYATGTIQLYVDGVLAGTGSPAFQPDFGLAEDALTIGDYNPTSAVSTGLYNFTGRLDEVFFYGRALDSWEVMGLADRHVVSAVHVSGPIVAHDAATTASWTDRGEPDIALEGQLFKGSLGTVWGSLSVNYKLLGPKTCTFSPGPLTTMTFYTGTDPHRVDIRNLVNSCDAGLYSVQLMERGGTLPRGGVFITQMPGDYTNSSPYELQGPAPLPHDYYLPLDRGNVVFWSAS